MPTIENTRDDLVPTDNDFRGNLEDWEWRVFHDHAYFRLHRYYGIGATDRVDHVKSYREAYLLADIERLAGRRVILYCVSKNERTFQITAERKDDYLRLWFKLHPEEDATKNPAMRPRAKRVRLHKQESPK